MEIVLPNEGDLRKEEVKGTKVAFGRTLESKAKKIQREGKRTKSVDSPAFFPLGSLQKVATVDLRTKSTVKMNMREKRRVQRRLLGLGKCSTAFDLICC